MEFYKITALQTLLYGIESWSVKATNINGIQLVGMRYIRAVKCLTGLNHIKNEDIRKDMKIESVQNKVDE
jgi:hypothetical protein